MGIQDIVILFREVKKRDTINGGLTSKLEYEEFIEFLLVERSDVDRMLQLANTKKRNKFQVISLEKFESTYSPISKGFLRNQLYTLKAKHVVRIAEDTTATTPATTKNNKMKRGN